MQLNYQHSYTAIVVRTIPTPDYPNGTYKVIQDGMFWGLYYVGQNWLGERFVADADERDGKPVW